MVFSGGSSLEQGLLAGVRTGSNGFIGSRAAALSVEMRHVTGDQYDALASGHEGRAGLAKHRYS